VIEGTLCPCCRQPLPESSDLLVDEEAGILIRGGRIAALTPQEASLFLSLRQVMPRIRTKEQLLSDLYRIGDEEPLIKIIDVFVCKLRRKLQPLGVEIETAWGRGYRLVPTKDVAP
jgi:DNA-binding response OmpR family regulator